MVKGKDQGLSVSIQTHEKQSKPQIEKACAGQMLLSSRCWRTNHPLFTQLPGSQLSAASHTVNLTTLILQITSELNAKRAQLQLAHVAHMRRPCP